MQVNNAIQEMIMDAGGPSFHQNDYEETPNIATWKLYDMLRASEQEVWRGNLYGHSQLSAVARLLNLKAEHHFSERCYDDLCQFIHEMISEDNVMTDNFYDTKKLIQGLGLPVEKIHGCNNGCMIYWSDDIDLTSCKVL